MQREERTPARGQGDVRSHVGAMTRAMNAVADWSTAGARELRVATVQDGRLGDEARHAERLRVGPTEKADVVVPSVRAQTLFERREGVWWLRLPEGLQGRLASGGPARTIAELRAETGDDVRLAPDARGRVTLGGVTILFQLAPPRPATAKPRLPQSVRGGALEIDWRFTTSLASVATLVFGLLIGLEGADWQIQTAEAMAETIRTELTFPEPEPPPERVVDRSSTDDAAEPDDTVTDDATPERVARNDRPQRSSERGEVSLEDIRQMAQTAAIGAIGADMGAGLDDILAQGFATDGMEEILRQVEGAQPGNRADAGQIRSRDTRGSGEEGGLDGLIAGREQGEADEGRGPRETTPTGPSIGIGNFQPEEPGYFDDRAVIRRLRGVQRRVQRCYEREVTRDPTLAGRISIELEVHPAGNVSARVTQNGTGSRTLGECVTNVASSIRFAEGPEGGSVRYGFPFIFSPQR